MVGAGFQDLARPSYNGIIKLGFRFFCNWGRQQIFAHSSNTVCLESSATAHILNIGNQLLLPVKTGFIAFSHLWLLQSWLNPPYSLSSLRL
jgi:hypothetical protein